MINEGYTYRFKTEKEFIRSYGYNWRVYPHNAMWIWTKDMDILFGTPYKIHIMNIDDKNDDYELPDIISYGMSIGVCKYMLKKVSLKPDYHSKKIIRNI